MHLKPYYFSGDADEVEGEIARFTADRRGDILNVQVLDRKYRPGWYYNVVVWCWVEDRDVALLGDAMAQEHPP